MFFKETLYNIFILLFYLGCCFLIGEQKETPFSTEVKKKEISSLAPIKREVATNQEDCIGSLSIDKLHFVQPLYDINSPKNQVDQHVTILKDSLMPGGKSSLVLLAAHSGNSSVSYFNDLDQLTIGDILKLNYEKKDYFYEIISITDEEKNGVIHFQAKENHQLILTTCHPHKKDRQLIISSRLIQK